MLSAARPFDYFPEGMEIHIVGGRRIKLLKDLKRPELGARSGLGFQNLTAANSGSISPSFKSSSLFV
jgi:hypothetical protein